jgi:hypothetical protein
MKRREQHGVGYIRGGSTSKIFAEPRSSIPWPGQSIASAGMAVTIYDHGIGSVYITIPAGSESSRSIVCP